MIWTLALFCLICIVFFLLWIKGKHNHRIKSPVSLANQLLHHPERTLIDIPLFIASVDEDKKYNFLLNTKTDLARMGKLKMRSQFLTLFTEVIKEPSENNAKKLVDFLFDNSSKEFLNTLEWNGKCEAAIYFLQLLKIYTESIKCKHKLKHIRKVIRKVIPKNFYQVNEIDLRELKGRDRVIAKEWFCLLNALYKPISPVGGKKKVKSKPSALTDPKRTPHLSYFQKIANEVYVKYIS